MVEASSGQNSPLGAYETIFLRMFLLYYQGFVIDRSYIDKHHHILL